MSIGNGAGFADRPPIGVICLDTSFDKIPGHIRNPATFDFPVLCQVVSGATPLRVVTRPDPALLEPFLDAARQLEAAGAAAITSACGFLALYQRELADAVSVPVFSSSLLQVPLVARLLADGQQVGVLTANSASLTPAYLAAAGAAGLDVCIAGMQDQPEFREVILEGRRDALDAAALEREVTGLAAGLARDHPRLGALVLECTDLAPFARAISDRTGRPVYDIVTLARLIQAGLRPSRFRAPQEAT